MFEHFAVVGNWLLWFLIKHKYSLQNIAISFILINFFIFYHSAEFTTDIEAPPNVWDNLFYVVEAWAYVFFALVIIALNHNWKYRVCWVSMLAFFATRAMCMIIAVTWGLSINAQIFVAVMFYQALGTILLITFLPVIKWSLHLDGK